MLEKIHMINTRILEKHLCSTLFSSWRWLQQHWQVIVQITHGTN